jgi:photosystem II stability/assembly factor-like uncharacterized protein
MGAPNPPLERSIFFRYDKRKVGTTDLELEPGATTSSARSLLETQSSNIVYVNFTTGDDATGDGSSGNPYKTYDKGRQEVAGSAKTHIEWMTSDDIFSDIDTPTQISIGQKADLLTGDDWITSTTPSFGADLILGVASDGAGNWVAVGDNGKIAYSTDNGDNWTQASVPSFGGSRVDYVDTDRSGNWVAVGASGKIAYSTDNGDNWTQATTPSFGADNVRGVSSDRLGVWVAVGDNGKIAYSTDNGDNWTQATTPSYAGTQVIGVTNDGAGNWVSTGASGKIAYSTDNGDNWTQASVPSFGADSVQAVTTNRSGRWVAVGDNGKIAYSTDNGDNWTQATTPSFGASLVSGVSTDTLGLWIASGSSKMAYSTDNGDNWFQSSTGTFTLMNDVATNDIGNWVSVGSVGNIQINNVEISADLSGVELSYSPSLTTANVKLWNVTSELTSGEKNIATSAAGIEINQCKFTNTIENAVDITSNTCTVTNSILKTTATGKFSLLITGTAAALGNIDTEFNTCIGDVKFDNNGGTGKELCQNSIIQGSITGTETTDKMTIDSGDIYNGTLTDVLFSTQYVKFVDPLFIDATTYKIQREVGYGSGTYDFDSPLVGQAVDHASASVDHLTSQGNDRDFGAWSYDDTNVNEDYIFSHFFPKPQQNNAYQENITPKATAHQGSDGTMEVANDPDRKTETIRINYVNLNENDIAILDAIERLDNMSVYVSIIPDITIDLSNLTVDGNQSAGVFSVQIVSAVVFSGSIVTIESKEYRVLYVSPNLSAATDIILDRALEDNISDTDAITRTYPTGLGEYQYLPSTRQMTRTLIEESEYKQGVTITLVRKYE